ncbi:MAG TPA: hypothetical protein VKM54_15650, partial [Myxococcota bacterium]|nr:hypothetical protein [Myxococcota bacterium]
MTRKEIAYLALAFSTLALVLYSPALSGSFVGDDYGYVVNNLYIQTGDPRDLLGLLDPFGPAALFIGNYAPLHLLAHAAELSAFGADTLGYHVVNVLVHGIGSALLAALFVRSRIPWGVAVLLALIFLVHPANVEAVAWVSQLKTCLSFALSVAALLALRRPVVAWALFTAALLTKFSAWYALPVAAVALWREGTPPRGARLSLAAWLASFVLCAIPEFGAFDRLGHTAILVPYPDGLTHVRSILAYAARYFVMATTSLGVSAFQEPAPALSWTDPWCLAGIVLLGLLGARFVQALRARSEEAVYWCWALAAYAPISQVFPFAYPMGDRYLYFVLPGLLGAAWFWTRDVLGRVDAFQNRWAQLRQAGLIALVLLAAAFSWVSFDRARVWRSDLTVSLDAARHYPNG